MGIKLGLGCGKTWNLLLFREGGWGGVCWGGGHGLWVGCGERESIFSLEEGSVVMMAVYLHACFKPPSGAER